MLTTGYSIRMHSSYLYKRVGKVCHFVVSMLIIRMERPRTESRTLQLEHEQHCCMQAIGGREPSMRHYGPQHSKTMSTSEMRYQPSSSLGLGLGRVNLQIDTSIHP